jgi:hypothetical protein
MTADLENIFPLTTIHIIYRDISDLNPIILDTMENRERKNRSLRFKKKLAEGRGFLVQS